MANFDPTCGRLLILKKYGIYRSPTSKDLDIYQKELRQKLYKKQKGICAISGYPFEIGATTLEHKIPYQLLRVLGFDDKERWSEDILCAAEYFANSQKKDSLSHPEFFSLFRRYWECHLELNAFEKNKQAREVRADLYGIKQGYK